MQNVVLTQNTFYQYCPVPKNDEERELQKVEDESYLRGRVQYVPYYPHPYILLSRLLRFIIEDAGRQSISGSFNPIDEGEWTEQAYMGPTEKFFAAIAAHDRNTVGNMIKDGIDVNRRDHVGRTPLQVATLSQAVDIAIDLIDADARMTSRLVDGRTVLHLAAQLNLPALVRKLLERSVVNKEAAEAAEAEAARLKEEQTMNVEDDTAEEESIASDSDRSQDSSEDDWNSDEAASTDDKEEDKPKDVDGNIPEDETEEPDVFDIDVQDWDYALSPLHYAVMSGSSAALDLLLASGANASLIAKLPSTTYASKYVQSLLLAAVTEDETEACRIVEKLLTAGAVSSEADEDLATVFHRIVAQSKWRLVSTLLARDPNAKAVLNVPYMPGYSNVVFPLVSAVSRGSYSTLACLLAYGAKINSSQDELERARDTKYVISSLHRFMKSHF